MTQGGSGIQMQITDKRHTAPWPAGFHQLGRNGLFSL